MNDRRPNPDELLERAQAEEVRGRRGTLKIFLGYAAGVGKTYAMLEGARAARKLGRDVVVGYVEPHGRPDTQALLDGLEAVPTRLVPYKGMPLREFDLDAALARKPDLILIDELAHTNAEGSRHAKRWQDVEDLLAAGIHVWSTLNVQHLDSLNDLIGQVTGVTVRETVPDHVFDEADDLELVDITPEELIDRLRAGKIYLPEQAERAINSFFQKSNLAALREFSLRQAARRIHTDVESARRRRAVDEPWPTADRLLVCVGPSPTTSRVIRTAKRMAAALDAPWLAVSVERPGQSDDSKARIQIADHFRLAERLGAETVTLPGEDVASALMEYARERNVTKILVGKTDQPRWRRLLFGTIIDDLLDRSGEIDIYVVRGEGDSPPQAPLAFRGRPPIDWPAYLKSGAVLALGVAAAVVFDRLKLKEANIVMAFLAAVALVAARWGRWPAVAASLAAVPIYDFLFVPPRYTFAVSDAEYVVTFAVMLAIALLISTLTARLKLQVESGKGREARLSVLLELGRQLGSLSGGMFLAAAAGKKVEELTGGEVAVYLGNPGGEPHLAYGEKSSIASHPVSGPAARWVIDRDLVAGAGTDTLPNAVALFLPLSGAQGTVGAIAVRSEPAGRLLEPDNRRSLASCAGLLALAIERDKMAVAAAEAKAHAHAEHVRNVLLSGVSHDFRTPLAVIAGASDSLLQGSPLDEATRRQLLETIADEANRLTRLLENILQMSRLEMGGALPRKQWNLLDEIVGSALRHTRRDLGPRQVDVKIPPDLPLIFVDGLLLEQLFVNLFENAARYTPQAARVAVTAFSDGPWLAVTVADDGPGLPPGSEERIFEKFHRFAVPGAPDVGRGSGLGLAICRAVANVHGGSITASNRPGGGTEFLLRLPLPADPPRVDVESEHQLFQPSS